MNDKTCGNCKYRGEEEPQEGYFLCGFIKFSEYTGAERGRAYVKDGSGYYAALCVSSDFGCNGWEEA